MNNTNIDQIELGMTCIVFIGYIVGKVWMYYKTNRNDKSDME